MGFYDKHVLPRLVDRVCGMKDLVPLRERVCAGLDGEVLEIGFGSGNNVTHYPPGITRLVAIEPSDTAWKLAAARVAASTVRVERSGLDAERLPYADGTFDHVLSTFTLCTIPDVASALAEVRRVLKPGGSLRFVEHGLAPDPAVRTWQRRLDGIEQRLAGGCHFTRAIPDLIAAGGFTVDELDAFYQPGGPRFASWMSLGVARPAAG